tara:strand:+ start:49 stop:378 length:330 start_codon:yes stop_codon:yes gene_type:complete
MADIIEKQFFDKYGRSGSCGDEISTVLSEFLRDEHTGKTNMKRLNQVADDNGIDLKRWSHLNMGHLRMNLGNVLRGKIRSGAKVIIGPAIIEGQRPKIKQPEVDLTTTP